MKTKFNLSVFSLLILLFTQTNLSAQSVWTTQYLSNINGNYLRKIQFINQYTGWACGGNGTLIRTTNGGDNWSIINCGTTSFLTAMYFLDANTGWIGSEDAFIRKTTNGGVTWYAASAPVAGGWWTAYLSFINAQTGYASSITKLSKTTDGGLNWSAVSTAISPYYNAIQFFNESTGFVLGSNNFYKTINGGANWVPVLTNTNIDEYFYFLNEQTGWILGSNQIRKTTNGGDNWSATTIPMQHPYSIKFVSPTVGWCVGQDTAKGVILRTTNAGATWVTQKIEVNNAYYDISFINANSGWVSGNSIISSTINGSVVTGVNLISTAVPEGYSLKQNFPNPFNPTTVISYKLSVTGNVSLKVFDLLGKEVATLVNQNQQAGSYSVDFNSAEYNLSSGMYFYTISAGEFKETRKMMLVK